jgi:Zn-dependent protease with chaperone function
MFKTTPTCSFLPLFACLLLFVAPLPLRAQDDEPEDGPAQKRAFLNVSVDYQNIIRVQLEVPAEVPDREQLKRSLSQSFSFPLEFHDTSYEDEELDDEASEEASQRPWTSLAATGPKAFSGGTLRSTFQIDPQSLLRQLQQLHVESLKVTVLFYSRYRDVEIEGAKRVPLPTGMNVSRYQADVDVNAGTFPVIKFSMGYTAATLFKNSVPVLLFLLLPALGAMLSARRRSTSPEELWGKHLRFVNRLLSLTWIVWLPIYFFSGVSEIVLFTFGEDHPGLGQIVYVALYFIPPIIAMFLCHLASSRVYEQVFSVDWSPRQVVRNAVIGNALSLIPMFLVFVGMYTFATSARLGALYIILGYIGYIILSQNMARLLGSRLHALTSGDLRNRIFDLAQRAGVTLKQVYVLPETSAQLSNAFARSDNSVLITNSLLKNLSRREVDGIVAHEIGHLQAKHPHTSGTITVVVIVAAYLIGGFITSLAGLQNATAFVFVAAVATANLIVYFRSRRNERKADAIGVSLTGDPEAFIGGLAKLSRLNLMPLHSGGWGESLDTHPGSMSRFQAIAKAHRIAESRLQELVTDTETPPDRYPAVADEVDATVFSSEFKNKYRVRVGLVGLAVLLLAPVPFAAALGRDGVSASAMLGLAIAGLVWSGGVCLMIRNRISFWGHQSACQRLKMKLDKRELGEVVRDGILVGVAPAAGSRKYEGYPFWDGGVLWLTKEKLYYVGEQCEFALGREQITEVYSCDTTPEWLPEKSLFIRWRDCPDGPTNTLYFVATGEVSLLKARRAIDDLQKRLQAWMQQSVSFLPSAPELASIGSPEFPEITSEPALMKFKAGLVFKAAFQLSIYAAIVAFAIWLSYTSIAYMAVAAFVLTFVDEFSRVVKGRGCLTNHSTEASM